MPSIKTALNSIFLVALMSALLAPSAAIATTAAEEEETVTWYDVEIIIFRQADPRTAEIWPADTGVPAVDGIRPLFSTNSNLSKDDIADDISSEVLTTGLDEDQALPPAAPVPFEPLPEEDFQLRGIRDSLARSSRYEPLLHVAWTQPGVAPENTVPLRITLPEAFSQDTAASDGIGDDIAGEQTTETRFEQFPSAPGQPAAGQDEKSDNGFDMLQRPELKRPLDGSILVYVKTYLHMNIDLLYLPEDINPEILGDSRMASEDYMVSMQEQREQRKRAITEALARGDLTMEEAEIMMLEPAQELFEGFRLEAKRRMRSREIHYFDHPIFGVITTITPREIPLAMDVEPNQ